MEFNYDFAGKLLAAILLLLVVSDQLTTPAADPRDGDATEAQPPFKPYGPDGSGIDLRAAALEEASLLLKLAERAIPYAKAPLVQAAAALGVEPSDTPQMDLSPSRRRPRRAARFAADSDAGSDASSESSSAEAAAMKSGKTAMGRLEGRVRELEAELGSTQARTTEMVKGLQRSERKVKELQFSQDEDKKNQDR